MHPAQPLPAAKAPEAIPKGLLRGMLALVAVALLLTTYAVVTDRPHEGVPAAGAVKAERMIVLQGGDAQAVTVLNPDGSLLMDLPHGGFITVVQNAMAFSRSKHNVDLTLPVRLVEYTNGRLAIEDPATGWSVELYAFGGDNEAAFRKLLPN
jgi:putative photosynthetic complex assembly protein